MTPAERKANERARNKAAGLSRLEMWAPPALHAKIKAQAAKLIKATTKPPKEQA